MTTSEFVENVSLLSEGKLPTFVTGSTKWLRIVAQGNFFLRQFARERGVNWSRYYDPAYSLGTVSATDTYDLDDEVRKISLEEGDTLRITHTDDRYTDYTIVPHTRLKRYNTGNFAARIGSTIRFNNAFTSSSAQFGGEITIPVYLYPEEFSGDNDEIDMPDPNWLVYMVAADRVKNDVTRKDLRADLIAQANEAMLSMKEDEMAQLDEINKDWNPLISNDSDW